MLKYVCDDNDHDDQDTRDIEMFERYLGKV